MLRIPLGLSAAFLVTACAAPAAAPGAAAAGRAAKPIEEAAEGSIGPARWIYTQRFGAVFDEAGPGPSLPAVEPAIVDGVRVLVEGGVARDQARAAERLKGFRSLPPRLGGGFVIWSEGRVYKASSFLGDLTPIADVDAAGGARPWLGSFLLRSSSGMLEIDPASLAVKRAAVPGMEEAIAADARRGVRVDALGRASITLDGGATWTDLLADRGVAVTAIEAGAGDTIAITTQGSSGSLRLGPNGALDKARDPAGSPFAWMGEHRHASPPLELPASSRVLPEDRLGEAAVAGALLPGGRLVVARDHGLRVISARSALDVADGDLLDVDEAFARCQPVATASPPRELLLACTPDAGGAVLSIAGAIARPRLEIAFPDLGAFVAGPRGRLAFTGRCGPLPPSGSDLGPGTARKSEGSDEEQQSMGTPPEPAPAPSRAPDPPDPEDARACVRVSADHWLERRLTGDDARRLYRWVPGDDGQMTALVLGGDEPAEDGAKEGGEKPRKRAIEEPKPKGSRAGEGVRVIHLDPAAESLSGGAFPAVPAADHAAPYRSIDEDFWQDDDGSIRGWLRLPPEGDHEKSTPPAPTEQGPAKRRLRVEARRGGRSAGVRIDASGRVTVFALPEGATEIVPGGRFGLAMAVKESVATFFETTDGGRTWTPIEGPPAGRIEPPPSDGSPFGCSAIGCTWGTGLVRLGWGGPAPAAGGKAPSLPAPAGSPVKALRPLSIECKLDTDVAPWSEGSPKPARRAAPASPKASPPKAATPVKGPSPKGASPKGASPKGPSPKGPSHPAPSPKGPSPGAPVLPVSLRLASAVALGELHEHVFSADVWMPFQPASAAKHLRASDKALSSVVGMVIPVLDASPREPLDLLLALGRRRLRAGAAGSSLLPFDVPGRIAIALDLPDGSMIALDASAGVIWIVRGEATAAAIRMVRLASVSSERITLARRLDGKGPAIVGYSTVTGDVFTGAIDLARAEVGPLVALGRLDTIGEAGEGACAGIKATHRFLADVPVALSIAGKSGKALFADDRTAALLLEGNGDRLCAVGLEAGLPRGAAADLSVRFGRGGAAAVRTDAWWAKGSCAISAAK
jgi:hypothetical protein